MPKNHHTASSSNKKTTPEETDPQNQEETSSFMQKCFSRIIPGILFTILAIFVGLFILGSVLPDDDDSWASSFDQHKTSSPSRLGDGTRDENGNVVEDIATNYFAVAPSCSAQDLYTAIKYVQGNMSKMVNEFCPEGGDNFNDWIHKMVEIKIHNDRVESERATKIPGKDKDGEEKTIEADKRVSRFIYEMVRWAKSAKGFQISVEKSCDAEKVLPSEVEIDDEDQHEMDPEKSDEGASTNKKKSTTTMLLADVAKQQVLPSLYKDLIRLLHFAFGVKGNTAPQSSPFTGKSDYMSDFAKNLLKKDPKYIESSIAPIRDILIKTMMSLADVAFALEDEDYHSAFMFHVIRFTDQIVTKYAKNDKKDKYKKIPSSDPKDKEALANLKKATPFFNSVILPQLSCASPHAALICMKEFGTRLVRAQGGVNYDQEPSDSDSPHYNMYLLGLLRAAFLEELIALRNSYAPIRVAYGYSLLELQRYESAQTTLRSALKMIEEDGNEEDNNENNNNNNNNILRDQNPEIADSTAKVLRKLLDCFEKEDVVEQTSEMQRRSTDNLRIFEKWHYWVAEGDVGAKKCISGQEDSDKGLPLPSIDDLKRSTMFAWPLKNQKVDGTIVDEKDGGREFVPLSLI